ALALGFDAVATGHYAQLRTGADGLIEMHRAVDHGKDQSYVLGCSTRTSCGTRCSRWATPTAGRPPGGGGPRPAGRDKPDSHDICFRRGRRQRGLAAREARRRAPNHGGDIVDATTGETVGSHTGPTASPSASAAGSGSASGADGKPRFVLDIEPVSGTVTVGPRERLAVDHVAGTRPRWCGTVPERVDGTVQLRAHGREHRAVVTVEGDRVAIELLDPAEGIAPGQAAVIYDGTRVVGSATIAATRPVGVGR
ncbi:tRNA methyl transferase, partial [Nocardioides exalbidus]